MGWIIYPWAVHEDIAGFIERVLSGTSRDEQGIMTALAEKFQLNVSSSDIRDALEDLLDLGRISRSGRLYTIRDPAGKESSQAGRNCC